MKVIIPTSDLTYSNVPLADGFTSGIGHPWNSVQSFTKYAVVDNTDLGTYHSTYYAIARENKALRSEDFSNAIWNPTNLTLGTSASGPFGGTAQRIVPTATFGFHNVVQGGIATTAGLNYTFSCYFKPSLSTQFDMRLTNAFAPSVVHFDIGTKVVTVLAGGTSITYMLEELDNGWFRASISDVCTVTGTANLSIFFNPVKNVNPQFSVGGSDGLYIWGAQLEQGLEPGGYLITTAAAVSNVNKNPATNPEYWQPSSIEYEVYASGTAYSINNIIRSSLNGDYIHIFRSVQNANTGHALTDTAWWEDLGPINGQKLVDKGIQNQCVSPDIFVKLTNTTAIGGLFFSALNCKADSVWIRVYNPAETAILYQKKYPLSFINGAGEKEYISNFTSDELPNGTIWASFYTSTLDFGGSGPRNIYLGEVVSGYAYQIGETQYGMRLGIKDYSKKTVDDFGNVTIVERSFSNTIGFVSWIDNDKITSTLNLLTSLRAKPAVYVGSEIYASSVVYGYYSSFVIEIAGPMHSVVTLDVEGLA